MRAALALTALGLLSQVACGPTCQSTCLRAYGSGVDNGQAQCGLQSPGQTQDELVEDCVASCENALANSGELGDYNPEDRHTTGTTVELENERQAAAWMECVHSRTCEQLDDGYCAPI